MAAPVVGIVGAKALRKDLNRLADDVNGPLYQAMKQAGKEVAQPVAALTVASLPHSGRPDTESHTSGVLAGSVRTFGTRTGARVAMGRAAVPYAGWVEFGGARPDGSTREYTPAGRYLFPAAHNLAEQSARAYSRALTALFEQSGLWTNTTSDGGAVHD